MEFIDIAKAFLQAVSGELDPFTEKNGIIQVDEKGNSVTLLTPSHIQFAKYGRGPGKMPPIKPLIEWVVKKGLADSPKEEEGTAWAIAMSIKNKGTKNWVPNAPNALQEAINKNLRKYYNDVNRRILDITSNEVNKVLEDNMKKDVDFKM